MNENIVLPARHEVCGDGTRSPIRAARVLLNMSQSVLGEAIGRDRSWISRLETGNVSASVTEKVRIAQILGLPVDSLFPEDEEE